MENISVIMSTYNEREADLKQAIESILGQSYDDFEFIIILDNPTNELHKKVIREYEKKDSRIRFSVNEENIGLALTLNKGIEMSKYDIIARMDADDISEKNRFKVEVEYLIAHPDVSVVSSNKISINENNVVLMYGRDFPTTEKRIINALKYMPIVVHPSVMFRKKNVVAVGMYRNFPAAQDYDLWLRLVSNGYKMSLLNDYLIRYRVGTGNVSVVNSLKSFYCTKYIRSMYKERQKHETDSYSYENLTEYLNKNKCSNDCEKAKFISGIELFNAARVYVKQKKIFKGMKTMFCALVAHKGIKEVVFNSIMYQVIKLMPRIGDIFNDYFN